MKGLLSVIAALLLAGPVAAQSPYAGEELAPIKSLSAAEIKSLKAGEGMGFAKLAELNRYPGPRHVLESADELGLTQFQLAETEAIFRHMENDAMALGEQVVEAEMTLDRKFSSGEMDAASLESALLEIGKLQARLRYVHLEAHLRQKPLLTEEQVAKYDEIRGYRPGHDQHAENPRHHD